MNDSRESAASSLLPLGAESAGLPAHVSSARTCPAPLVSISSASVAIGSSPATSGRPRTRLFQRPWPTKPSMRTSFVTSTAGLVNIEPPARSRLPVTVAKA